MTKNDPSDKERIDYTDADTLEQLYIEEELSTNDIADRAGVSGGTIRNWMEKHGIDRRNQATAAAMKNRVEYANYALDSDGYPYWQTQDARLPVHQLLAIADGADPRTVFADSFHTHHIKPIPWLNTPENITVLPATKHVSEHHRGERHHRAKVTPEEVNEIRGLSDDGLDSFEIADRFELSPSAVRYIVRGDNWPHVD